MTAHEPISPREDSASPWVVFVGGFLGAGKTTLLIAAARELEKRGLRSAMVLNDQGSALVDTRYASLLEVPNEEVTGGCFCCRFRDMLSSIGRLRAHRPDVILAEPVGSCTDIAATVLRPLLDHGGYRLAPFTVLIDPQRAEALLRDDADPNLVFLFRKQIEEADLICFSKSDASPRTPSLGKPGVRQISARTNQGIAAWLDEVLSGDLSAGRKRLEIDYLQYAQAEAALAWLNLQAWAEADPPASPGLVLGPFLDALDSKFRDAGIAIVHLKAVDVAESGFVRAAICSNGATPVIDGTLDASPARNHELLLNLRCVGEAERVRNILQTCLEESRYSHSRRDISCFHPATPRPEHRYA